MKKTGNKFYKAQAITEMGVFGTLMVVIFAVMISHFQLLYDRQRAVQRGFRHALGAAHLRNSAATTVFYDLQRDADVNRPLAGRRGLSVGAGSAFWGVGYHKYKSSQHPTTLYVLGEDVYDFPSNSTGMIASHYKLKRTGNAAEEVDERIQRTHTSLATLRDADISDSMEFALESSGSEPDVDLIYYNLGSGGKYKKEGSPGGRGWHRTRSLSGR